MFFLFKPHITGSSGAVTTPDVIVDTVTVDGTGRPPGLLTMSAWLRIDGETGQAGYALTAIGGGALISPVVVVSSGLIVLSRGAWRLSSLDEHVGQVTLNGTALSEVGLPGPLIAAAGETGDTLPRGAMVIQTAQGETWTANLADPVLGRAQPFHVVPESVAASHWPGEPPRPRYSVGPTQTEVTHYI
ncbi:MAG: hypothetical protein AAF914_14695 [Pseudomonadota bacterium]